MSFTAPTNEFVASFLGVAEDDLADAYPYMVEALGQANLLLEIGTGVSEDPEDATVLMTVRYGIAQMAEALDALRGVRTVAVMPFSSERIGNYTYMIGEFARKAASGIPSGIMWFDLAVKALRPSSESWSNSTKVFEDDATLVYVDAQGQRRVLGPLDIGRLGVPNPD